jgi:uncharacterized membrane protein
MRQLLLFPLLALTACASRPAMPAAPAAVQYSGISHDPLWLVSVEADRIVLTTGPGGGRADGELTSYQYPGASPTLVGGVRRWESGQGTAVISVEARKGPCSTGGEDYPDRVRVYLSGRVLEGCGGRELGTGQG